MYNNKIIIFKKQLFFSKLGFIRFLLQMIKISGVFYIKSVHLCKWHFGERFV